MRHAFLIALLARLALGGAPPTPRLLPALRRAVDAVLPVAASRSLQDEPSGEVTVDFSPRSPANQALAKALRFEDSGDWTRAAHIYQRLLAETPAELCQVSPRLYRPVGAYALERIAAFPADSLRDYRQSIEPAADQAWRDALDSGSLTDLERVSRQFLLSHRGDDALDRLATAWLARGRAGAALRAWASLLRSCPESDVDLAALTVKLAFALRQLGRPGAAAALLDEAIAILGADTTVPFAGAPVPLSTLRSRVARSVHRTRDDAAWPLLRGDALQSRTAALAVRPGALAWSQQLHPRTTVEAKRPPYMQTRLGSAPQRGPVTILPVLADGLAIYPSRRAIHARRTATGKLAWATAWPPFPDRALDPFASPGRTSGIWSCSVDRGRVYCSVPLERTTYGARQMETRGELLALGLAKGQLLWRLTATSLLPKPLESGWFTSPPTAYDNSLLIGLRGGESGYEYHLCALDADDGRLLWRTFLASRPSTTQYGGYGTRRWFEGPPAVSDGLAVADTEGGALAAVDVATGRVRWLSRYDQRPLSWRFSSYRTVEGWRTAGAVISDGIVYATPTSSDFAYAVDLGSGHILWRRERRDDAYLAAVRTGRAYFVGSRATCVGRRGTVLWDVGLPQPATGRPVLAGRVLHIPLQSMLIFLDADSGHVLHRSVWTAWEEEHAPVWNAHIASGDLLVAAGSLFASTQYTLNAFAPAHPLPDIEHALAASPDRPDLHLALAVEKQWEGALALAAKSYEKALALAIEPSEHFTEDHRRQARSHLSATYTELARQHEAGGRTEAALRASRAALRHAPDRSSPPLLLRVAALCEKLRRWREAVDACQQVLAAPHVPEASWRAARLQVARILTSQGPKPYAQHEAAATALLGRDAADALEQLVRAYPNSTSAPTALLRLAAQANAKKQSGAARAWLHRLARDYPASPLAPSAIYRLAVGHAGEGGAAMARGALHTLRVRHPDWKGVHAGQAVTARVEADAFLGAHLPPDAATLSPVPAPPFRIDWVAKQEYGSSELYVRGDEGADPKAIYFLLGISLESRSVKDGSLLWADRPGWLGISILDALLPEGGVRVGEVIPNTPAERAGFRVGDILTHFNRVPLRNTLQLIARCTALRAGSSVTASFLREGKKQEVKVVLGERPTQAGRFHLQPNSFAGLSAGNILIRRQAALDAIRVRDGHRVWSYPLGDVVDFQGPAEHHLTASAPGILVAALESGRLLAADPANGRHLWTARIEEPTVHALALWEHGLVVASSRPCAIRVLNPFTGDVLFEDTAPRAVSVPVFALDTQPVLCYAIGSRIACLRPGAQAPDWSVRAEGLHVERVLLAETTLVVQGTDDRGVPTFHAHRLTDGAATWRLPLLAGESLVAASLEAGALYLSTHRGAAGRIRRVDAAAGRLVWSKDLARDQEAAAWNTDGATLTLGLTRTADTGRRRAEILVLDKRSGADLQRLELGDGKLSSLVRIGPAFYAVIEGAAARAFAQRRVFAAAIESARFHVVRIVTTR